MNELPPCPKCKSALTYDDGSLLICPECAHEWSPATQPQAQAQDEGAVGAASSALIVRDANGNLLSDGDTVTIIKDLKVKGAASALKVGTKVRNIRLVDGDHNIDCRIDGFGAMQIKSEFVKKS